MSSVKFFDPVYIRLSQNASTVESGDDLSKSTFWETTCTHIINVAEFIFDFGFGTAYSITPKELATKGTVELLSADENQGGWKLLQGIMLVVLAILFPLGGALLWVKASHHDKPGFLLPIPNTNPEKPTADVLQENKESPFTDEKACETKEDDLTLKTGAEENGGQEKLTQNGEDDDSIPLLSDSVIPRDTQCLLPGEKTVEISDSMIARDMELTQCLLLKEGGSLFNRLEAEVLEVNEADDAQLAEALSLNLFYFKNYYQTLLKKPKFTPNVHEIQEALSSLDALQKRIHMDEISRTLDCLISGDSESIEGMEVPFKGINNVGNSCYIASVMQMIYSHPHLQTQLEEFDPANIDLTSLDGKKYYGIVAALQKAMRAYDKGSPSPEMDCAMENIQHTLLEFGLIEKAENPALEIKKTIDFLSKIGTSEEDLKYMRSQLDELNEGGDNWEIKAQGEPREILLNVIEILGQHCSLTETLEAADIVALQKEVTKMEALIAIPLEKNAEFSFESGLKKYFSSTLVDENDEPVLDFLLEDGTTKKAQTWYRKTSFTEAPRYFVVQLNRLLPVLNESEYREELCTDFIPVDDKEIDLSDCYAENRGPDSALYRICSVIIQIGTGQQGHYVALRRDADGSWYKCNDSKISPIDGQHLVDLMGAGSIYLMEKV